MKRGLIGDHLFKFGSISLVIILCLLLTGTGSAKTVYVGRGNSIQDFINNSTTGDFIVVEPGIYQQNVTVNVSGITIMSDPESLGCAILKSPDVNSSVFQIETDNVTIKGFNIMGSGKAGGILELPENGCPQAGICLKHASNCTIERNNISEKHYGIYLQESMSNMLSQNNFTGNGIWLDEGCSQNTILNNVIEKGSIILGAHCWDDMILQNQLSNGAGISIACCGGNIMVSGNVINNSSGIDIYDVQARTFLHNNQITYCNYGISYDFVFDSEIYNNTISNSSTGIYFREECHENNLSNNKITSSRLSGIYFTDNSANNRIYNNYFNNTINARVENSNGNSWNTSKTSGTSIVGGPYLGGNFWADPIGNGFSQTANDSNSDRISDLPYRVNGSDIDHLPLI